MNLFLSVSISGHGPFPGFMCANSCFAVFLTLIGPVVCDDLSPMTSWGSGYAPSCCDCCCGSHNKGFVPWIINHFFISPNPFKSWGVDNIESTVNMEHVRFIVD